MMRTNALLFALFFGLFGCDEPPLLPSDASIGEPDSGPSDAGPPPDAPLPKVDAGTDAGPPPAALVRLLHVAPGHPTVDLFAQDHITLFDVYYRAATPYARIPVGAGVLSVKDASTPEGEPLATSAEHPFEDGARYLALLSAKDGEPTLEVFEESAPDAGEPFSVRVLNATHDTATLDVDLDGEPTELEAGELEAGAWSDWIALEPAALRPMVLSADDAEPFTIDGTVAPWLTEVDQALLVVAGRPVDARPSDAEGLSLVLVLEATETASPFFILRPDPHLTILQASPALPTSEVAANPSSGAATIAIAPALGYGELVTARLPPGRSFVRFTPEGELFGQQDSADLLPGHRYLMVTRGTPNGSPRFEATVVREAIEGDGFVLINASPDSPEPVRWYTETAPDSWTALDPIMAYGERSVARGIALDPTQRLGVAQADASSPELSFVAPSSAQPRGFVVLADAIAAEDADEDALTAFWVWAPPGQPWTHTRAELSAPLPPAP